MICASCKNKYEQFMLFNYNLDLCQNCFKDEEIVYDFSCDALKHKITCPKCGKIYDFIVDEKCTTKKCNVWFFWDKTDCRVFAKWKE